MASALRVSKRLKLIYKGKPMRNPREFLRQCCAGNAQFDFMSSPVDGVLRPGEKSEFIRLMRTDANAAIWEKLNTERLERRSPHLLLLDL